MKFNYHLHSIDDSYPVGLEGDFFEKCHCGATRLNRGKWKKPKK